MVIIHPIDNFIYEIFPNAEGDLEALKLAVKRFYSIGPYDPIVEIKGSYLEIVINTKKIEADKGKYQKLISLCETSKFEEAKRLALTLISESPNISEYHRILGQVYSELGNQEEAVNSLIDALRWNPNNEWALLMMGNIFARDKGDVETALKYYNQVLKVKPDDNIALNNIGANLMQLGKKQEALTYFNKALEANPNYPNTYYAIALVAELENDFQKAFDYSLLALERNKVKDKLYANSFKSAIDSAKRLKEEINSKQIIDEFAEKLKKRTGKEIKIQEDPSIPTAAKIEYAENYDRDHHLIKFKPQYPSVEHLVLHELIHLQLTEEARDSDLNQLYITRNSYKNKFFHSLEKDAERLYKKGVSEQAIANYLTALFEGLNRQIFNTPIDLFIEDRIYYDYPLLKPIQFLSLLSLLQEGIDANTRKEIVDLTPSSVLAQSKIYNLTSAIHFNSLYNIDLTNEFKPTRLERKQAEDFYNEFLEYRFDKEPGEEYELVKHWAEDLKLDMYFDLIPESSHQRKTVESVLDEIESNPFDLGNEDPTKERKMKKFFEAHADKDLNMAVTMYMVSAIQYFENLKKEDIKKVAFEIAMIGMSGIDPGKDGYVIPSIKNSSFSGYQTLAYYYVSWALSMPDMLNKIQLPFHKEFELAKKLVAL